MEGRAKVFLLSSTSCLRCNQPLDATFEFCSACGAPQPSAGRGQLAPGRQIERGYGRIVVEDQIGAGAMGTVYRGWLFYDPRGPRGREAPVPLALKQLHPHAVVHPAIRAFFQNEAEALRMLAHPNVVRFYDWFVWAPIEPHGTNRWAAAGAGATPEAEPPAILAMEFVEGDTLEDVIARNVTRSQAVSGRPTGLPFDRAWYYVQQLLGALAAGHALGIVHRDVKPSNVLIRRDGIVKLTDYGIAHLVRPTLARRAPGPEELAPGTGAYMSPEQVLGHPLDGRSDLYSVAIVLYEAVAGRPPFLPSQKGEFALRLDQIEAQPPPIRAFLPSAPPLVEDTFARALAKHPDHRFPNAIEMGEAFRAAFGIPSTPEWRALGELAQVAREGGLTEPLQAQRLATLRQVVAHGYRTQPLPGRPLPPT